MFSIFLLLLALTSQVWAGSSLSQVVTGDTWIMMNRFSMDKKLDDLLLNYDWESRDGDMLRVVHLDTSKASGRLELSFVQESLTPSADGTSCTHSFEFKIDSVYRAGDDDGTVTPVDFWFIEHYSIRYGTSCDAVKMLKDTPWEQRRVNWLVPWEGNIQRMEVTVTVVLRAPIGSIPTGFGMRSVITSEKTSARRRRLVFDTASVNDKQISLQGGTASEFTLGNHSYIDIEESNTGSGLDVHYRLHFDCKMPSMGTSIFGTSQTDFEYLLKGSTAGDIEINDLKAGQLQDSFVSLKDLNGKLMLVYQFLGLPISMMLQVLPPTVDVN